MSSKRFLDAIERRHFARRPSASLAARAERIEAKHGKLPADVRAFYARFESARLFDGGPRAPYSFVPLSKVRHAGAAAGLGRGSCPEHWLAICQVGGRDWLAVDARDGRVIDCSKRSLRAGEAPVVARSSGELLRRALASDGAPYWRARRFKSYGNALAGFVPARGAGRGAVELVKLVPLSATLAGEIGRRGLGWHLVVELYTGERGAEKRSLRVEASPTFSADQDWRNLARRVLRVPEARFVDANDPKRVDLRASRLELRFGPRDGATLPAKLRVTLHPDKRSTITIAGKTELRFLGISLAPAFVRPSKKNRAHAENLFAEYVALGTHEPPEITAGRFHAEPYLR
jgi:hypothetical protein